MPDQKILLQSGTNEMELLVFVLGEELFAVNVAKVQSILQYDPAVVTPVPQAPEAMLGMLLYRGHAIPLIDLSRTLDVAGEPADPRQIVIVMEFNNFVSAYRVDGVRGIERLTWKQFEPISDVARSASGIVSGSVHLGDQEVLVVDMECILTLYVPDLAFRKADGTREPPAGHRRSDVHLVFVEDSLTIRKKTVESLMDAGYQRIEAFPDGRQAYDWLVSRAESDPPGKAPDVIISDIEMPRMDGLTLCRRIREKEPLESVPFIMFSSLINPLMIRKCRTVGADHCVTKPETDRLIAMLDEVVFGRRAASPTALD